MSEALGDRLRAYALGFPGAHEDQPWGESVVKVDGKVFVFGPHVDADGRLGLSVKLPLSAAEVLSRPGAAPTGYGLGKAGWVSIRGIEAEEDELRRWLDESYRAVAKKRRIKERDGHLPASLRAV